MQNALFLESPRLVAYTRGDMMGVGSPPLDFGVDNLPYCV